MNNIVVPKNNSDITLLVYTSLYKKDVEISELDDDNFLIKYKPEDGESVCSAVEEHESYNLDFPDELVNVMWMNMRTDMQDGIEQYFNSISRSFGFEDIKSVRSYTGFDSVYQEIALEIAKWSVDCWVKAEEIAEDVLAGNRDIPTLAEVIAEFPAAPTKG